MPKITVLMPIYNAERYLREAIDSVLTQTYTNFQFLIVEHASTDSSCDIVRSYNDSRICLLHSDDRLRLAGALNKGLDVAQGEYIARMDADDICHPKRFSVQVHFLDQHPSIGICGTWAKSFGVSSTTWIRSQPCSHEEIKAKILFESPFIHPTVMMRKRMLDKFNLRYNDNFYPVEDLELWARAVKCFPCENINKVLLYYRIHKHSMTGYEWTYMDSQARIVVKKELQKLIPSVTENDVYFHRNIGRGLSYRCRTRQELERAEKWFVKLIEANSSVQRYEMDALRRVIGAAWYRICFNSAQLGIWLWKKFKGSPLNEGYSPYYSEIMKLWVNIMWHAVRKTVNI